MTPSNPAATIRLLRVLVTMLTGAVFGELGGIVAGLNGATVGFAVAAGGGAFVTATTLALAVGAALGWFSSGQ